MPPNINPADWLEETKAKFLTSEDFSVLEEEEKLYLQNYISQSEANQRAMVDKLVQKTIKGSVAAQGKRSIIDVWCIFEKTMREKTWKEYTNQLTKDRQRTMEMDMINTQHENRTNDFGLGHRKRKY